MTGTEEVPAGVRARLRAKAEAGVAAWLVSAGKASTFDVTTKQHLSHGDLVRQRLRELEQEWLAGVAALALV